MTNEEAIAIIRNEYKCVDRDCDIERSCGKCDLMMPSKEPILEAYKLAIKALEQTTWIPVSEKLPEDEQEILFSTKTGRVHSGKYHDDDSANQWYSHRDKCRAWNNVVSAWMPLPLPWEGE